ncbi:MAG: ATP-binding protein, partial [Flavobacteriaceae bacterium]
LGQENGAQVMNAHEQSSASFEISVSDKFGAERYWLVSVAPLHNERGGISGSIIIQLDITDQKVLEIQKENLLNDLEESNKNLEEYAHIVSHDLKSPLRSINALATWIGDDFRDKIDEMGRENLKLLQEKVELMDKLIDGILKYSTASKKAADNSKVNLNAVIKEITDIIYIPDHVEVVVANPLPTVYADRTKMHQLFQNFLSNAVVHIENPKGLVEVSCQEVGNHWQFAVKDNGVGIPKEYHEKIFKIFQSAGSKERSTGIGLSIVKKIVELYEGTVWLESEVGKGTTFYFTIKKQT